MNADTFYSYDDLASDSHRATPAMFVKGVGRGQLKPVDPMTIRLPKFLLELAIEKSNKLSKSSEPSQLAMKTKGDIGIFNRDVQHQNVSKKFTKCRLSSLQTLESDTDHFDWHAAKMHKSQGSRSSSFCTFSSSAGDANVKSLSVKDTTEWPSIDVKSLSVKDMTEWPTIDSMKANSDNSKELPSEKIETSSLDFKSIGKLLSTSDDSAVNGCHVNENGLNEVCREEKTCDKDSTAKDKYKLCLQNIPSTLTEVDLMGALSTYGAVKSCQIFRGMDNNAMAIVAMDCQKACDWAISCLHGEGSPFPGYQDGKVPNLGVFQIKENEGS